MEANQIIGWVGGQRRYGVATTKQTAASTDALGEFEAQSDDLVLRKILGVDDALRCSKHKVVYLKDASPSVHVEPTSLAYCGSHIEVDGICSIYDVLPPAAQNIGVISVSYTHDAITADSQRRRLSMEKTFSRLRDDWKQTRGPLSSITQLVLHPSYQSIIGLGLEVVPYILKEMSETLDHWFWALKAITGEDPIREEQRGNLEEMTRAWLSWGKSHNYI
jgi:hypothetical protein